MSLVDRMKQAGDKASKQVAKNYQQHQAKVAELKDARGAKIGSIATQFMGGYADRHKATGTLTFYEKRTEFNSVLSTKFVILNSQVKDIAIEGKDEVNRRVTVTRLLAVGIFAFALKKKNTDKEAYLTIELSDGQEIIFFIDKKSPMELKAKLAKVISRVKRAGVAAQASAAQPDQGRSTDELIKLADLKEKGILTQEEFNAKKKQLLGL